MSCCNSNCNHDPCGSSFNQLITRAGQYAQYAQTQANKAEDLWLEFNALYLGAFASAPTMDNEGNPLQVGALYWNSVSNELFAWNGAAWNTTNDFDEFTPFLATGTTTARNLATRFADVINVKDFGAVGDGVADDTDKIQAALNSIPFNFGATGKAGVYFPKGQYNISGELWVKSNFTGLFCDGFATAQIKQTNLSAQSAILVKNPASGGSIFAFSMQNINIIRDSSSTFQTGVILESCNNTHLQHIEIVGFPTALDIRGGVNCHYDSIRLDAFGSTNTTANRGVLELNASAYTTSPVTFTHIFTNSKIGANFTTPYCIKITSIDYITFSNCYFGGSKTGGLLIQTDNLYANYNNNFDNCYFDRASLDFGDTIQNAITMTEGNFSGSNSKFTDCFFGLWDIGAKIDQRYNTSIEFTGCKFSSIRNKAIEISGNGSPADSSTALVLTGNQFKDAGLGVGNATIIDIQDVRQATITGNSFYWDFAGFVSGGSLAGTKKVIAIASGATVKNISITGNVFNEDPLTGVTYVDFENLGTVNKLVITGNASNNPTNTLVGSVIGNQLSSNPLMLDWYQEGTFNPIVKFGGADTGITYTARIGNFTRIGNRMIFDLQIQLSSKGSATGNMTIEGFPFALSPSGTSTGNLSVSLQGVNTIAGNNVDSLFNTTTTIQSRYIDNSGNSVIVNDTHIRNDTIIFVSGSAQVA